MIGFVFQGYNLLARNTALENVELPLVYRGVKKRERRDRAAEALSEVGLEDRMHHTPNQLSGGQQQRVAIARALVAAPRVLLADEPTGNLDSRTSYEVLALLQKLNRASGITIVLVTHEPDIAACTSRTITMRDGRVRSDVKSAGWDAGQMLLELVEQEPAPEPA
jgi:putative ABC transport system ATP-binding protein